MGEFEGKEVPTFQNEQIKQNIADEDKPRQRTVYYSDRMAKAIILKTLETGLDKSGVVRAALEIYLKDLLEKK